MKTTISRVGPNDSGNRVIPQPAKKPRGSIAARLQGQRRGAAGSTPTVIIRLEYEDGRKFAEVEFPLPVFRATEAAARTMRMTVEGFIVEACSEMLGIIEDQFGSRPRCARIGGGAL